MRTDFKKLFKKFDQLNVLVVGDVMIDSYLFGSVDRISPEAPVPVVSVQKREIRLGGAANVALNLRALGAAVTVASVVGKDEHAANMLRLFKKEKIGTKGILLSPKRITTVKHRIISNNHQMLRIDEEITSDITATENKQLLDFIQKHMASFDVLIFEDYDKGLLNEANIPAIIGIAESHGIPTVVDPKKRNFLHYKKATLFKPNLKEMKEGLKSDRNLKEEKHLKAAVKELKLLLNNPMVMVTLSENGVAVTDHKSWVHQPAHLRNIADVSGAGDTVVSVAALCVALKCDMETIAYLSNLAGGLVCEKVGVVPITREELLKEAVALAPAQLS